MRLAELADDRRRARAEGGATRVEELPRPKTGRQCRHTTGSHSTGRRSTTGFEPFLIAALLGLVLWALILTAIFL